MKVGISGYLGLKSSLAVTAPKVIKEHEVNFCPRFSSKFTTHSGGTQCRDHGTGYPCKGKS
jgi:hypothetical protein